MHFPGCRELEEAHSLAVVLSQAATAALVEEPEIGLPRVQGFFRHLESQAGDKKD